MLSVLAALAVLLQADAAPPTLIEKPDWFLRPRSEDFARVYPKSAMQRDILGRAVLRCTVANAGNLTNCQIESQLPKDEGFGTAALRLSTLFRMRPLSLDGQPTTGRMVRIPIRFVLPGYDRRRVEGFGTAMACYGRIAHLAETDPSTTVDEAADVWRVEVATAAARLRLQPSDAEDALVIGLREAREGFAAPNTDVETCLVRARSKGK